MLHQQPSPQLHLDPPQLPEHLGDRLHRQRADYLDGWQPLDRFAAFTGPTGYGIGLDDQGNVVRFAGDHRPLRHLGDALAVATEPIEVEVTDWQVLSIGEARR